MNDQQESLRYKAVHGAKWKTISTIVTTILMYGRLVVLAHLLSPEDFGLMGMILVVIGIGMAFEDMGLTQAVIWKQDLSDEQLSTLYWLNLMAGAIVFILVITISPLVAAFYKQPGLVKLMLWMAFAFPVVSIGNQFQTLMAKELKFKRLAFAEITSAVIGVTVAITAAFLNRGVLSLVWGQLAIFASASLIYVFTGWRDWHPKLKFNLKNLKKVLSFGAFQLGQRLTEVFSVNVDYIMVGRFLGPEPLGIYMLAWQLMVAPMMKINPMLTKVAFPVFAKRQDDDGALCRGYGELSKMVAVMTLPIMVLAAVAAPVLVSVVFGEKWLTAVPLIRIFVLFGLFRALSNPIWSMLWAKGRANLAFFLILIFVSIITPLYWFAAQRGLYFMAWSEVVAEGAFFIGVLLILKQVIGLRISYYFKQVAKPLLIAGFTGLITYAFYYTLDGAIRSNLLLLITLICIGLTVFLFQVMMFDRQYYLRYVRMLCNKT